MNTPTPRTDATVTGNSNPTRDEYEDLADFACKLERELATEREKVQTLERENAALRNDFKLLKNQIKDYYENLEK